MANEITHGLDSVLKDVLLKYNVTAAGAFEFMQEQVVTSPADRHALRALMWQFAVSMTANATLPPYNYSKMNGRDPRTGRPR